MTTGDSNSIPADAPLNAKGREVFAHMDKPRMTLREELNQIGCHSNGDARCTCVVAQDALDQIDRMQAEIDRLTLALFMPNRRHET